MDWRERLTTRILRISTMLHLNQLMRSGSSYALTDYFRGLEKIEIVRKIFGEKTEEVIRNLRVEFTWIRSYMWVDGSDGHLVVSSHYLNKGDKIDVYLDLIHELVHIRQFMEGKQLYDSNYGYSERPTEVEAYRYAVEEARNLGLSDKRICEYLKAEWMTDEDLRRLSRILDVRCFAQNPTEE